MGGSVVRPSHRWLLSAFAAVGLLVPTLGVPTHADELDPVLGPAEETYPDLVPNVTEAFAFQTFVFDPETGDVVPGPPSLAFDTWSQNLGTVALDLVADDPTDLMSTTVSQCVAWEAPGVCRDRRTVGGFVWHDEHTHFHYQDFASYELRRVRRNGQVDYRARGLVGSSDKVSFCLLDSTTVRADANPIPTYVGCTPAREGISPGWTDIYTSDLDGQQISLEGLSDGRYALVVTQDYNDTIYETNDDNNKVEVIVELTGLATATPQAQIIERRYP